MFTDNIFVFHLFQSRESLSLFHCVVFFFHLYYCRNTDCITLWYFKKFPFILVVSAVYIQHGGTLLSQCTHAGLWSWLLTTTVKQHTHRGIKCLGKPGRRVRVFKWKIPKLNPFTVSQVCQAEAQIPSLPSYFYQLNLNVPLTYSELRWTMADVRAAKDLVKVWFF